jgi:pectinesterase inhibitor-like protein
MRRLPAVAWSRAIATVLLAALTSVVPVVIAGERAEAAVAPREDNVTVDVSRIAAAAAPSSMNVTAFCQSTPYPSACETALSSPASGGSTSSTRDPFAASVQFAMSRAASARTLARNLSSSRRHRGAPPSSGMEDCAELLDISLDQLGDALAAATGDADGVTTWLSAALTNQGTCADSLAAESDSAGREAVRARVSALTQFIGTALALHVNKLKSDGSGGADSPPPSEAPTATPPMTTFPSWVSQHDRKLLHSPADSVMTDAVVALDGSGTHRSINEAIAAVTTAAKGGRGGGGSGGRKVIHVKAGRYEESVTISSKQKNVVLMGDGKGKTIIVGHKSAADGYTTYATATVGTYYTSASIRPCTK